MAARETLIVVAHFDDSYKDFTDKLEGRGGPVKRVSTADGGHPTKAFIDTFRFDRKKHDSYLFLQDSLDPQVDDVVKPFRDAANKRVQAYRPEVVAWAFFPMFFDNDLQHAQVTRQFPALPPVGIFGPVFYAERRALEALDRLHMFPRVPHTKMEAQGTERAWSAAFFNARIPYTALGKCIDDGTSPRLFPEDQTFVKVFGNRQ